MHPGRHDKEIGRGVDPRTPRRDGRAATAGTAPPRPVPTGGRRAGRGWPRVRRGRGRARYAASTARCSNAPARPGRGTHIRTGSGPTSFQCSLLTTAGVELALDTPTTPTIPCAAAFAYTSLPIRVKYPPRCAVGSTQAFSENTNGVSTPSRGVDRRDECVVGDAPTRNGLVVVVGLDARAVGALLVEPGDERLVQRPGRVREHPRRTDQPSAPRRSRNLRLRPAKVGERQSQRQAPSRRPDLAHAGRSER